jgi:fluoride exporter
MNPQNSSAAQKHLERRTSAARSHGASHEPCPDGNLSELAAPPPAAFANDAGETDDLSRRGSRRSEQYRRRGSLALSRRSSIASRHTTVDELDCNLSELAAPPPANYVPTRESAFLEDRGESGAPTLAPSPPTSTGEEELAQASLPSKNAQLVSRLTTELVTVSYLIFFSILGTLARLGVQWLTFYPGASIITPVVWANAGGSFVMGSLAEDRTLFQDFLPADQEKEELSKVKKTILLYIGLATGFCGSFTSFSTFMRDSFLAMANDLPSPVELPRTIGRNGGYSFEDLLAVWFTTLALSLGGLQLGAHSALLVHHSKVPAIPRYLVMVWSTGSGSFLAGAVGWAPFSSQSGHQIVRPAETRLGAGRSSSPSSSRLLAV